MSSTAPKPPAVGSLWGFVGLEEPTRFVVVVATASTVYYRTAGTDEEVSSRPLADFLAHFEPA